MDRRRADFGQTFPKPVVDEKQERAAHRGDAAHCASFRRGAADAQHAEAVPGRDEAGAGIVTVAEVSERQVVRATLQKQTQGTREIV